MSSTAPEGLETIRGALGVSAFDHVAVAVHDAERALELYVGQLGARFVLGGDNDTTGVRVLHLGLGGFKLELLQPLRPGSLVSDFLDGRGEGFHHVTFRVEDLPRAVAALAEAGIHAVGTDDSTPAWEETFIRPRDAGGVLVQLAATTRDWSRPVDGIALEDVLAGRVRFEEAWPCWRDLEGRDATAGEG